MNRVGILVIGDEILCGRVVDSHVSFLAQRLATRGMDVCEVRMVGDKKDDIVQAIKDLRAKFSYVFTTGGIGSTHDDITTQAVAEAVDWPLVEHPDVMKTLVEYFPRALETFHPFGHACIPEGAALIANPISHVPSFVIDNIYVLPGMPHVMHAMVEALLPTLPQWPVVQMVSVQANVSENLLAQSLNDLQKKYPDVSIGSYPYVTEHEEYGTALVARSRDDEELRKVHQELQKLVAVKL